MVEVVAGIGLGATATIGVAAMLARWGIIFEVEATRPDEEGMERIMVARSKVFGSRALFPMMGE